MTPEAEQYLHKARRCLADAAAILTVSIAEVAGKEAYLAGYHAAAALIFERTGKIAKTHKGVRAEFARLTKDDPTLRDATAFLARAYELKSIADYGIASEARITLMDAEEAIEAAGQLVARIADLLVQ